MPTFGSWEVGHIMTRLGTFFCDHCKWKIKQQTHSGISNRYRYWNCIIVDLEMHTEPLNLCSFTSSIIIFSFPFKKVVYLCTSFSCQGTHVTKRTTSGVATEAGKVAIHAGGIGQSLDHDTSDSCYDVMTCYCNIQAILKSRKSSGSLWIPPSLPWRLIVFRIFR